MKLSVSERLIVVQMIPEKGNFKTMTTVENLRKVLYLSEEERKEYEVEQVGNQLTWNEKGSEQVEVKISDFGIELVMESFEKLDKNEDLTLAQFLIYKYLKEEQEKPKDKK